MPKISVIVPVYNVKNVLQYSVESILNQTYKDFEVILIDDGSNDKSGELCNLFSAMHSNISSVHVENGGVSKARNLGIEIAKGDYICFIDSDDFVEKTFLQTLIEAKNSNPCYDNIWCGFQTVDGYEDYHVNQKVLFTENERLSFSSRRSIMSLHEKWLDTGPVCKLYSRKIIYDNSLRFPEDISLGEDLVFNYDYLDCTDGKIMILNKCLYNYVIKNYNTLSTKFYSEMFEIYKKLNSVMYEKTQKWNCTEREMCKYYNACFHKYEVVLQNTFHPKSSIQNKYKYNKSIMKSAEFREALSKSDCFIHPLYRFGYDHCMYRLIRLLDKLVSIKNKLFSAK